MPENPLEYRSPRTWEKIIIELDPRMTEAVSAYLADLSGSGLEISTSGDDADLEQQGKAPPGDRLIAYIPVEPQGVGLQKLEQTLGELDSFLARLPGLFPGSSAPVVKTELIAEEDWNRAWKSFFTSFQITPGLTIKPSWEEADAVDSTEDAATRAVIEMDPGLAFGTGHHASTRLALLLLDELIKENDIPPGRILDIGTGSGILAMGCALFGAESVLAIDNDPDAVATAQQNIARNRLEHIIEVSGRDIDTVESGFDLVVANITHDILAEMAGSISRLVNRGGSLVLSGILRGGQEDSIRELYTGQGFNFIKELPAEEWVGLLLQKI